MVRRDASHGMETENCAPQIFPSNFPCNSSEDQSQELLKCCVASRKINKLGSASLPPEQKAAGSSPAGRTNPFVINVFPILGGFV